MRPGGGPPKLLPGASAPRSYSQIRSPLAASSACTISPGFATYSTPSCTRGVVCCGPGRSAQLQTSRSSPTFPVSIWSSGLCPWPSRVRRQLSQSDGSGFCSIASVTGV